jgi:hypothetical protein
MSMWWQCQHLHCNKTSFRHYVMILSHCSTMPSILSHGKHICCNEKPDTRPQNTTCLKVG